MDHRLYHAVRPPLTIRQSPPQRIYRLVVVAGDIGRIAQQLRRQSLRTGRVHHVPRRQLVACDLVMERAAEIDVQRLHTPADTQNGPAPGHKGVDDRRFPAIQPAEDIPAARQ